MTVLQLIAERLKLPDEFLCDDTLAIVLSLAREKYSRIQANYLEPTNPRQNNVLFVASWQRS
jgi:hypothetical protein